MSSSSGQQRGLLAAGSSRKRAEGDLNLTARLASSSRVIQIPHRFVRRAVSSRPRCHSALLDDSSSQKRAEGDLNRAETVRACGASRRSGLRLVGFESRSAGSAVFRYGPSSGSSSAGLSAGSWRTERARRSRRTRTTQAARDLRSLGPLARQRRARTPQGATRPRSTASPGSRECRGLSEFLDPYLNTTAGSLDGSLRSPSRFTGRGGFEPEEDGRLALLGAASSRVQILL